MKWYVFVLLSVFSLNLKAKTVTVYTYDSLASKHSFGKFLSTELEKDLGIKTELVSFSTVAEAINQLKLEGAKTRADILWGFDSLQWEQVQNLQVLQKLPAELVARVESSHPFSDGTAVAFDYGYLAFVFDSRRTARPKEDSFLSWAKSPELKKKVIIQDPRTSSLGQSLLAWVAAVAGESHFLSFWTSFAPALVTVAPGWSSAYGAFLKKESDFVLSYTTSPAYHVVEEKVDAFRSVVFKEGHFKQIEAAGLVKHSRNQKLALQWLDYLLGKKMQTALPTRQWMFPAAKGISLPEAFQKLPQVKEAPKLTLSESQRLLWTKQWNEALSRKP